MSYYNYEEQVLEDAKNWVDAVLLHNEFKSVNKLLEYIDEYSYSEDSITGNASGSYTFSSATAHENLCDNLYLLGEAIEEMGIDPSSALRSAEAADVTIRYYILSTLMGDIYNYAISKYESANEKVKR